MTEAESLFKFLQEEDGWHALDLKGVVVDGWRTVDVIEGDDRRWSRNVQVITESLATGDFYRWSYEHGLTEYQDHELSDKLPEQVLPVDEVVTIRHWKKA